MIKKLKRRFVTIMMFSVFIVFSVIMLVINIVNYSNIRKLSDEVLNSLAMNNGEFIEKPHPGGNYGKDSYMTEETPYETRYFSLVLDSDDNIVAINTTKIALVDIDKAIVYCKEVIQSDKESGYLGNYRFKVTETDTGRLVLFMDCTKQLFTAREFLKTSIIVSFMAIISIFILALLFSKRAIAPIAQSYEKQKKFITDASHELKTPLTIISANTELIEMESGESEYTKIIQKQVNRLTSMTKNLVLLSKIDESDFVNDVTDFSLSDACDDVCEGIKKTITVNNKELNTDITLNINYNGNEGMIRRLIYLLLDNANKYSLSKINVVLTKVKNNITLIVSNDTLGIEKGNLMHYCNRFYRTDEVRASSVEGSGIGLSIVKEIVDLHNGNLKIYSPDGITYTVEINL